jgi:UDP-N-acetylmuramoyl-L-alanine---L-glutamate ligase
MRIQDLNGKKVCILGFGKEGKAMLGAIERFAPGCDVTIADQNETVEIPEGKKHQLGTDWLKDVENFDVIIKSPGIPPNPTLDTRHSTLTTSTNIFFDSIEGKGAWVIGVTGSKGKSTTSSLLYAILKAAGKDTYLVGNIGMPAIEHIGDAKKGTIFVLEMSSYQLMDTHKSPHIAVVTSFFPEHLDYHGSLEDYLEAKKHIARFQTEDDIVVFSPLFDGAVEIAKEGNGRKIPFTPQDSPLELHETHLLGEHNLSNIAAAFTVSQLIGIPKNTALKAIGSFKSLPHRLQPLGMHHGIEWIDDAISTTPESATAAVKALGDRVHTIILGGQDRGLDFKDFGHFLAASPVRTAIFFPGSGPRIKVAVKKADPMQRVRCLDAASMEEAVKLAQENTPKGKICLLSTASPSYGMFTNFEEKGEVFAREIRK